MAERSVAVRLSATVTGYVAAIKTAKNETVGFYKSAIDYGGKHQAQLDSLAIKAGILGAGMVALGGFAVKAAMDWESAWAGVTKTVDGTPEQLAKIEQGLQDMSAIKPTTAIELAAIAESAGALGVKTDSILEFTSVMADLGETTNLSSEEAATSIAQLMNVMQTAPEDVDNLGATIVDLGNKGASTERQIVQMAQNIAGAGAIIGLSEANVLALGNALASSGIEAEAGGSAISNVLMDIDMSVKSGNESIEGWADVAGMSAKKFAAAWKADPADALASFIEGLGRMNDSGENVFATLEDLGQSDIRVTRALLNMAASGGMLRESLHNGDVAWQQNTALAAEAAKRYDTTASQVKMSWNEIKTAAVDAGTELLPIVADIAGVVSTLANAFQALPGPAQTGLTAIVGIGGVALIAAAGLTKAITTVATLRTELAALQLSGTAAGATLGALAKGGAGLAAFWAGAAVGDKVGERNSKGIEELANGLEKLGKSGKATGDLKNLFGDDLGGKAIRFGKDLGSIGDALKSLDGYADDNSLTETLKFFGSAGQSAGITAQAEAIGDIDKAMATLARNKPDAAIAAFEKLRDRALETGASTKDIERAFPSMTSLLQDASKSMGGTSDAAEILDGNLTDLGPAAQQSAEQLAATEEALDKARESALATGLSFLSFSRNAKTSFSSYLADLEKGAQAFEDFTKNAIVAADKGLDQGFIDQLKEQGPEGALLLADFADASEKEIARANRAFRDTQGLADLEAELSQIPEFKVTEFKTPGAKGAIETAAQVAKKYKMTPQLVTTILEALDYTPDVIKAVLARLADLKATENTLKIGVDVTDAEGKIQRLQQYINGMHGKTVRIAVKGGTGGGITVDAEGSIHTPNGRITAFANGGLEDHVAQIGNGQVTRMWNEPETGGEAYIPLASGKRPRSRNIAEQTVGILGGRVEWFANGGVTGRYEAYQELTKSSKLDLAKQDQEIRRIQASLDAKETVGKGKNKHKRDVLRGRDRTVAQLELAEAKAELKRMKADNAALKNYGTSGQEKRLDAKTRADADAADKAADEKTEADAKAAADAAEAVAAAVKRRDDAITGIRSTGDLTDAVMRSPASVDRALDRSIADIGTFTTVLSRLKEKGAAPWLLAQLVKAGPTRSAIRLGEKYLADSAALDSVNVKAAQLDAVSNTYADLTTNEMFMAPGAWASGIGGQAPATQIQIQALDISLLSAEIARQVDFRLATTATGGGI